MGNQAFSIRFFFPIDRLVVKLPVKAVKVLSRLGPYSIDVNFVVSSQALHECGVAELVMVCPKWLRV